MLGGRGEDSISAGVRAVPWLASNGMASMRRNDAFFVGWWSALAAVRRGSRLAVPLAYPAEREGLQLGFANDDRTSELAGGPRSGSALSTWSRLCTGRTEQA